MSEYPPELLDAVARTIIDAHAPGRGGISYHRLAHRVLGVVAALTDPSEEIAALRGTRRDEYWEDWLNNASWEDSVCLASERLLFFIAQDAGDVVHLELTQVLLQQLAARMAAVQGEENKR